MSDEHRAIVLDTETTGFETSEKHRIVEIGAVEIINRKLGRTYEQRVNPGRDIDPDATRVHGMTRADLAHEPTFAQIIDTFLAFVGKADIIGHFVSFDLGFLNYEINKLDTAKWTTDVRFSFEKFVRTDPNHRSDICTRKMCRRAFPDKPAHLDNLCDYLGIDRSHRVEHGALKDAKLTALCWLALTRGNEDLFYKKPEPQPIIRLNRTDKSRDDYVPPLMVIKATGEEEKAEKDHLEWLAGAPFARSLIPTKGESK